MIDAVMVVGCAGWMNVIEWHDEAMIWILMLRLGAGDTRMFSDHMKCLYDGKVNGKKHFVVDHEACR